MKKLLILLVTFTVGIGAPAQVPEDLLILQKAYPHEFIILDDFSILMNNGTRIPYDDREDKTFEEKLVNPDLEDMMSLLYPPGVQDTPPEFQFDPGRFRNMPFFEALYGSTEEEIRSSLTPVLWMPGLADQSLYINRRFGISHRMDAIIAELQELPETDRFYLSSTGGSFNYRFIAGTSRLSMHSFGMAVDIRVDVSHYWRWEDRGAEIYKNNIPYSIVEVFEKYGFIWGGKWYHFDTMHFEYRPELLLKAGVEVRGFEDM